MRLKWEKHYHRSGVLGSVETSIVKSGFPGLTDTHRAVILPFENGTAMAYIRMNDSSDLRATCLWGDKTFKSIRAAQGWAKSVLERI
jgi:hypothetical protein